MRNGDFQHNHSFLWPYVCVCFCAFKGGTYDSELMRLLRERDELQSMLDKYERHLAEVQANVRVLTTERDKTRMHYQQVCVWGGGVQSVLYSASVLYDSSHPFYVTFYG